MRQQLEQNRTRPPSFDFEVKRGKKKKGKGGKRDAKVGTLHPKSPRASPPFSGFLKKGKKKQRRWIHCQWQGRSHERKGNEAFTKPARAVGKRRTGYYNTVKCMMHREARPSTHSRGLG